MSINSSEPTYSYDDSAAKKLFEYGAYDLPEVEKLPLLKDAVHEELKFHYENNPMFARYCANQKFNPFKFKGELEDIPAIPVRVFKELGNRLSSVEQEDIKVKLESSATSGVPSTVLLDKVTAKRQALVMAKVMAYFLGKDRCPFMIMDIDPNSAERASLGARGAAVRGYLRFATEASYFIGLDEDQQLEVKQEALEAHLEAITKQDNASPVIMFGFTFVLYASVVKQLLDAGKSYQLPKGSKVIHIGGWKKLEAQKVSREKFNDDIAELFGITPQDVIDIYGFTEQMGLNYPDFPDGWKRAPTYGHVLVRNETTMEICAPGEPGLLEFISPVPHSYPGNVVLTDDVGIYEEDDGSIEGVSGRRFKVLGRAKKAEVRGCGDIMANKVVSAPIPEASISNIKTAQQDVYGELQVLYHADQSSISNGSDSEKLAAILKDLNKNQAWLRNQPVDALAGLIELAQQRWMDHSFELGEFRTNGLAFLAEWSSSTRLRALANAALKGKRGYLDGFMPIDGVPNKMLRATPRGLIGHWLSGNVPVLGMLVIVQCILSKNANLVKVAATYSNAIPALLKAFEGLSYTTPGGYTIHGEDLLKTISVVYFDRHQVSLATQMSVECDIRIAWGGGDAINAVKMLPQKWSVQDIMFGPKLSYMVIAKEAMPSERFVKKICRRAAVDASVFDQTACASPHTIFVERGGAIPPEEFAERLGGEMQKAYTRIPKGLEDQGAINAINSIRSVYQFEGKAWHSEGPGWTVLYDDKVELAKPTYSRVITVRAVDHIDEATQFASSEIQTIGLAATGKKRLDFAEKVTTAGVERCPDIGTMTHFDSPWDGMYVMDRIIKWVTLGGP